MLADATAVTLSCYLFCSHAVAVETAVDSATISAAACRYLSSYAAAAAAVVSNQLMQRERNLPLDRAIAKAIALFYAGGFFRIQMRRNSKGKRLNFCRKAILCGVKKTVLKSFF